VWGRSGFGRFVMFGGVLFRFVFFFFFFSVFVVRFI